MSDSTIIDPRPLEAFKDKTFSDFKKREVINTLIKSIETGKVEDACYWITECIVSGYCIEIFEKAINNYHVIDDVYQAFNNPLKQGSIEHTLFLKSWIDTVQWHYEDIIRDPNIDPQGGMKVKATIDKSNQNRVNIVEQIDDWFLGEFGNSDPSPNAKLNSESPAWIIDKLSILTLKIYHMNEQCERTDVDEQSRCISVRSVDGGRAIPDE